MHERQAIFLLQNKYFLILKNHLAVIVSNDTTQCVTNCLSSMSQTKELCFISGNLQSPISSP
jgi:hypothetical protein